jgi:hypothetical protein
MTDIFNIDTGFKPRDMTELTPRELVQQLMRLPAKERLAVVLSRADAEDIVNAFSMQDYFFFVKEIGPDDASPLLALGRVEQLVHLFDLEWWNKDGIQPAKSLQWLERLAFASEEKLLAWLYQTDFELLVTLFKKWIHVVAVPEDTDLLEAAEHLPQHTLDDQYFWEARYLQFEDFLTRLLSLIFEVQQGFYRELMTHIIWVSEAEFEEDAHRFCRGRLEDQGIPDFYDALEIYRAVHPEEIEHRKDAAVLEPSEEGTPLFAVVSLPEKDLLNRVLEQIGDAGVVDTLRMELASLANKVIMAEALSVDEPQALHRALAKVSAYVNLGLDIVSGGQLPSAMKTLGDVFLEYLFRLAHTHISRLKSRLQRLAQQGWLSQWPTGLKILESDWLEKAELMLQKTPRLTRQGSSPGSSPQEDFFRERRDLVQAKHFLEVISALGPLFAALSVQPARLSEELWPHGQIHRLEEVTLGVMIWTAAAQFQISGNWEVAPLEVGRWLQLFAFLQPKAMEPVIRSWVLQNVPDEKQQKLAAVYLDPLFQEYEQEMSPFRPDHPPDPRLVRFFIYEREGL